MTNTPIPLNTYQDQARQLAIYPGKNDMNGLLYTTLGLTGESGEIANKVKKIMRDHGGSLTEDMRQSLIDEVGDVLWYVANLAAELGITLSGVAVRNINKLEARRVNDSIKGAGDKR